MSWATIRVYDGTKIIHQVTTYLSCEISQEEAEILRILDEHGFERGMLLNEHPNFQVDALVKRMYIGPSDEREKSYLLVVQKKNDP